MASGKNESDYFRCSVCEDGGRDTTARHFCVDCEVYFCGECVKTHKILKILKSHQLNDLVCPDSVTVDGDTTVRGSDISTCRSDGGRWLRCNVTLHDGKMIDTYCKDHDEVCCGTCAVIKHRECTIISIAIASKDFKSCPDIKKRQEALTKNLTLAKLEKTKRVDNIERIEQKKLELIQEVDEYEERIMTKVKELADVSRGEIRSRHEKQKTSLTNDVIALDAVITTSTSYINKLDEVDDEELLFANVKTGAIVTRDSEAVLQTMATEWEENEFDYYVDTTVERFVEGIQSLGQIVPEYKATFQKNVDVKQNDSDTNVYDMCLLDSRDLVLTDYTNQKLKRFSSDLIYKDELVLSDRPVAVCKTGKNEVAVRILNSKVVHFVSVGESMQLTSSITLDANGGGMTYAAGVGEIYACEENKVSVYSKTGTKLRTYDQDTNGEQIFSACIRIVMSENKQDIYVTDINKGLIVLDSNGAVKMKVSMSGVNAWPLCLLPGGVCLVGCYKAGLIDVIHKKGKQVENLIKSNNGRKYTSCALYDRERGRLLVGGYPSVVSIYTM